jgi:hypothetical protein
MYEELIRKAEALEQAALRSTGGMRELWAYRAQQLREQAVSILIADAEKP